MKRSGPRIVGLTGSIGMGKTTVARMFSRLGVPVFCADSCVHDLLAPTGKAFSRVSKRFPSALGKNGIDRNKLAAEVLGRPDKIKKLESLLHPLVWRERDAFLKQAKRNKEPYVLLDIPLLFETGADKECDMTLCVSAKAKVQKERVMARKGMNAQKWKAIRKQQMPDSLKRQKADIVIRTDVSLVQTKQDVKKIWQFLKEI